MFALIRTVADPLTGEVQEEVLQDLGDAATISVALMMEDAHEFSDIDYYVERIA